MEDIIVVDNLTKKYGDFTAVNGTSFSVKKGEIFGILGPNGAGKTTTLEMIEGLKPLTSGTVTGDGHDVTQEAHLVKSIIGVQLQSSAFFDGLNLLELIDMFAAMYGRTVDAMQLLQQVQLTEKAKSQVKELSGGQKQRLSIAVALVNDPKVLFLDEPTTGLDPQARRNLWELIRTINKEGKTIVITTHYLEEAEILCDRVGIMDNAKLIALDTVPNLLKRSGVVSSIILKSSKELDAEQLSMFPGVEQVIPDHPSYRLVTSSPQQTLPVIFSIFGRDVLDLQLKQATLEDVFLKLTGHTLRD
ncbi:MAG: transporter ATP-binding protein [Candidatus Paceibacter sp.]|nr:transporter ATP-binding protein [Candidatus Paceibacter sp.]